MAKKISDMDAAAEALGPMELEVNNAGSTEKLTIDQLITLTGSACTGWLSGGEITINADDTKFDYASGTGLIVDASDPTAIAVTAISWTGQTAVDPEFLATQGVSFLAIDINGDLIQSATFPVGGNLRDSIQLGGVTHGNNTDISNTSDFTSAVPFQLAPGLTDLMIALGVINLSGNVFEGAIAGNLKLDKTVGSIFYFGIASKATPVTPNNKITPVLAEPQILFSWRDGAGGFNTTVRDDIAAGVFDDDSGGDANGPDGTVTTNNWTNLRIHYSPDLEETIIQWGTTTYGTSAAAIAGINSDFFGDNPSFAGVPVRGYLSIRGAAADLTLAGDAVFTETNKFGDI